MLPSSRRCPRRSTPQKYAVTEVVERLLARTMTPAALAKLPDGELNIGRPWNVGVTTAWMETASPPAPATHASCRSFSWPWAYPVAPNDHDEFVSTAVKCPASEVSGSNTHPAGASCS